ncbi:MAG TPA: fused MFS/spermidine synthase [Capillimicrobium sp.]|jgi:predicted membrane-bound spermidine synthase
MAVSPAPPTPRRGALIAAAAISGAALMAVEFAGQRLLAVHWGDSVTVWGAAIATVLGGLTVGYAAGGRIADRRPERSSLALALTAAALTALLIALVGDALAGWLAERVPGLRTGALLGSAALLLAPSVLLGLTSPIAARLAIDSVAGSGRRAGDVYAAGNLGSIAGALGSTFWLVEALGTRGLLAGAAVAAGAAGLLVGGGARATAAAGASAAAAALAAAAIAGDGLGGEGRTVEERDTAYAHLRVADEGGVRYLWIGSLLHSAQDLDDPERPVFAYTRAMQRMMCAGRLAEPGELRRAAMLGVGGGTLIRSIRRLSPTTRIDAVEIDPGVLETARRWFGPPTEGVDYVVGDGRRFLAGAGPAYDLLILDAYGDDHMPPHLLTREFFAQAAERVADGGVLAVNFIGPLDGQLTRDTATTLRTAFADVEVYDAQPDRAPEDDRNLVLLAGDGGVALGERCLRETEAALGLAPRELAGAPAPVDPGEPFTDARPPVLAGG